MYTIETIEPQQKEIKDQIEKEDKDKQNKTEIYKHNKELSQCAKVLTEINLAIFLFQNYKKSNNRIDMSIYLKKNKD